MTLQAPLPSPVPLLEDEQLCPDRAAGALCAESPWEKRFDIKAGFLFMELLTALFRSEAAHRPAGP